MKILYLWCFLLIPVFGFSQITGTVHDNQNAPISGVTVLIEGTNIATNTNEKGVFQFKIDIRKATIKFTSIDCEPLEFYWSGQTNLKITLKK
jgi:hypothetical protein